MGSKSLVTSCVEPYTIVGGIPAKVLGSRLDIDTQKKLEESGWVDLDIDMAIKKLKEIDWKMFDNKIILITGGTGSFGKAFVKRLLKFHTITDIFIFKIYFLLYL